jgi:hypothetical protein
MIMAKQLKKKSMDGNEAASYIAYAFTEVSAIFPITPSSPMADHVDKWAANGVKNIFGKPVNIIEMQSEHGAIGTLQGALEAGSLGSTYTSSQGLLLMIPAMNRVGEYLNLTKLTGRILHWSTEKKLNVFSAPSSKRYGNISEDDVLAVNAEVAAVAGVLECVEVQPDDNAFNNYNNKE